MLPGDQMPPEVREAAIPYFKALSAADVSPNAFTGFIWDVGSIVVNAYKKLGPNATASQMRDYLAGLRKFAGVSGIYDFKAVPQAGIDSKTGLIMVRYDAARSTFAQASSFGGL